MVSQDVVVRRVWPLRMRPVLVIHANLEVAVFPGPDPRLHRAVQAVQVIPAYTDDIREIVVSGIPVYKTSDFETVENLLLEEGVDDE
jgi:hypothetical protein